MLVVNVGVPTSPEIKSDAIIAFANYGEKVLVEKLGEVWGKEVYTKTLNALVSRHLMQAEGCIANDVQ